MHRPDSNIGIYFHKLSKDISQGGKVRIPKDHKDYPPSWKKVEYKSYANCETVKLFERADPNNPEPPSKLTETILVRKSAKNFNNTKGITLKELSTLINYSISKKKYEDSEQETRVHPSGGARYSLEYYFLVQNSLELKTGIYHYNIFSHKLEFIQEIKKENIPKLSNYEWVKDASVIIFMTSIFDRNMRKYGERGYRYILLEAGHVGQNIYLISTAMNLPVRAVAGTYDTEIEKLLNIDGVTESLVYTIIFG